MKTVHIPGSSPIEWKRFLAEPEKQWKTGYSAKTLAYCWHSTAGFPRCVQTVLQSGPFSELEALIAIPEHQVPLPGGSRPSQNDVWVLAKNNNELVSVAVEGKVSESFDKTIKEWAADFSEGKKERLSFLLQTLGLPSEIPNNIRYQLLHRTASAIIEAKRFNAQNAIMLVHSFSQSNDWFEDYSEFLSLYGVKAEINKLISVGEISGINLFFAWAKGDPKYLEA